MTHIRKLANAVGVGEASLNAMMKRAETDPEFYKQQFKILKSDPLECLDVLIQVSLANGTLRESEFEVLKGLANQLEIQEEDFRIKITDAVKQHEGQDHFPDLS